MKTVMRSGYTVTNVPTPGKIQGKNIECLCEITV